MSAKTRFRVDIKTAFKIFSWGVDYGLLLAEQEREQEEYADAFNCCLVARKTAMPAIPIPRRQLHSGKWIAAKKASLEAFQDFLAEMAHETHH